GQASGSGRRCRRICAVNVGSLTAVSEAAPGPIRDRVGQAEPGRTGPDGPDSLGQAGSGCRPPAEHRLWSEHRGYVVEFGKTPRFHDHKRCGRVGPRGRLERLWVSVAAPRATCEPARLTGGQLTAEDMRPRTREPRPGR